MEKFKIYADKEVMLNVLVMEKTCAVPVSNIPSSQIRKTSMLVHPKLELKMPPVKFTIPLASQDHGTAQVLLMELAHHWQFQLLYFQLFFNE